jgi:hypothetical protein
MRKYHEIILRNEKLNLLIAKSKKNWNFLFFNFKVALLIHFLGRLVDFLLVIWRRHTFWLIFSFLYQVEKERKNCTDFCVKHVCRIERIKTDWEWEWKSTKQVKKYWAVWKRSRDV